MKTTEKGNQGEDIAVDYLLKNGYTIEARNYNWGRLEIDIIASHQKAMVFIEVKLRGSKHYGAPWQAVNSGKQQRLIKAAHHYLNKVEWDGEARFDIISIIGSNSGAEIQHIESAYYARV
ncbi:MAG: YraN family protein [Flavobacteriales bacterium]